MPIPGLATILEHCQPCGADPARDRIVRELKWWADVHEAKVGYPGVYGDRGVVFLWRREKVLQLAAALPIPPDVVATCDQMATTLEELIALLAMAVLTPPAQSHAVTLPDGLA